MSHCGCLQLLALRTAPGHASGKPRGFHAVSTAVQQHHLWTPPNRRAAAGMLLSALPPACGPAWQTIHYASAHTPLPLDVETIAPSMRVNIPSNAILLPGRWSPFCILVTHVILVGVTRPSDSRCRYQTRALFGVAQLCLLKMQVPLVCLFRLHACGIYAGDVFERRPSSEPGTGTASSSMHMISPASAPPSLIPACRMPQPLCPELPTLPPEGTEHPLTSICLPLARQAFRAVLT